MIDYTGAINSVAINQALAINGAGGSVRIDVSIIDDEFSATEYILGKLNGTNILCPGQNANVLKVPLRAGALIPTNRRVEK